MLELKSPIRYDFTKGVSFTHKTEYQFNDPVVEMELQKTMNRYFIFNGELPLVEGTFDTHNPSTEQMMTHYRLQALMNHCVNAAEDINDRLKFFVMQTHVQNDEDEIKLAKTGFMGLRDIFSKYIKKYPRLKEIEGFENANAINLFTDTFNQYIIDRNIYTHGQLGYHVQEDVFCIKFLNGEREGYAEIDMSILNSFLEVSKEIIYFLGRISSMYSEDEQKGQGFKGNL